MTETKLLHPQGLISSCMYSAVTLHKCPWHRCPSADNTKFREYLWWATTWQSKGQILARGSLNTRFVCAAFKQHQFKSQNQHHPITPYSFPSSSCATHLHWQCWQHVCVVASIREAVLVGLVCSSNSADCSTFSGNTTHPWHLLQPRENNTSTRWPTLTKETKKHIQTFDSSYLYTKSNTIKESNFEVLFYVQNP